MVSVRAKRTMKSKQGQRPHPANRRVAAPRFVLLGYLYATRLSWGWRDFSSVAQSDGREVINSSNSFWTSCDKFVRILTPPFDAAYSIYFGHLDIMAKSL